MDLDDLSRFKALDPDHMLGHIDGLPDQLLDAWKLGIESIQPGKKEAQNIVVCGMGGSAIGADLAAAYLADQLRVPMVVHRDYGLPAFCAGQESLVIISSHSGNTEEPASGFEEALARGCQLAVLTTGGDLQARAENSGIQVLHFNHVGQPRTAVGFSFGMLLAFLFKSGLIIDQSDLVSSAVGEMTKLQATLRADIPVLQNPAKRLAGQLVDKHVTVFGSGFMVPVARRWKTQLNEVAKAVASFEAIPEADHNTLAGICNPAGGLSKELALFLRASADLPRNQQRLDLTREIMMLEEISTDFYTAKGSSRLDQMWTALLFGDYLAYYLAMAYGIDPTPIPSIIDLKERMAL
jgi:glucose/mannose-6-phosphate isomerase